MSKPVSRRTIVDSLVLTVLVVVAAFALDVIPMQWDTCEPRKNPAYKKCTTHEIAFVAIRNVGKALEEHNGAVSAVAAVFIAAFTFVLTGVSTRQAEMIPQVERAYVFVDREATIAKLKLSTSFLSVGYRRWVVFKNYGKTPAILHEVASKLSYFTTEPPRLKRSAPGTLPDMNVAIGSGESTDAFEFKLDATEAQIAKAGKGEGVILLIGAIWYYDMLNRLHETGFCWQWDGKGFRAYPSNSLNYHT